MGSAINNFPILPPKGSTKRKRYVKGIGWCGNCHRIISGARGRCTVCTAKLVKVEDKPVPPPLGDPQDLGLNLVYLDDGRVVDRESGEFQDSFGRMLDKANLRY